MTHQGCLSGLFENEYAYLRGAEVLYAPCCAGEAKIVPLFVDIRRSGRPNVKIK